MKSKTLLISIIMFLTFMSQLYFAVAASIGVSPGAVFFNDVLKDGYAEKTITVSTNYVDGITAHFEVEGEIKDWIRFEPENKTFFVRKDKPYKVKIIVNPPEDAQNNTYTGIINIFTDYVHGTDKGMGSAVLASVFVRLGVEVTGEEIVECAAGSINLKDTEEGYPLELELKVYNMGNVRLKPKVFVDVWDQNQETLLLTKKIVLDEILPTVEKSFLKTIYHDLGLGQYWAFITVPECNAEALLTFNIFERGSIVDKGVLLQVSNKLRAFTNETVAITALFQNTGPRMVLAQFKGKAMLGDKIVSLLNSDELSVLPGEKKGLVSYFSPKEPGRYEISGRVLYNNKLTFEKGSILTVLPAPKVVRAKAPLKILPLVAYLVLVVLIVFFMQRIRSELKKRP